MFIIIFLGYFIIRCLCNTKTFCLFELGVVLLAVIGRIDRIGVRDSRLSLLVLGILKKSIFVLRLQGVESIVVNINKE